MTTQNGPQAPIHLNGHHQHTYETIFRHPMPHNLEWHDVRSLLTAMAKVTEGHNGSFQVARNGRTAMLHVPKHKDVATIEDVMTIRRFLEESSATAIPASRATGADLLVVIDHHEAKIFRSEAEGSAPQQIVPYDPHGFGRHLRSDTEETDGKRKPERKSYYEAIAATLRDAERILIFGSGTGESSAMEQLLADLRNNHGDVAKHIVGSVVLDTHHQSEGELLARAREFFASKDV